MEPPEPVLDLQVNAYIDDRYVGDPAQKVELYQKIINVTDLEACAELEDEITDRFGDPPDAVYNLLQIGRIRVLSRRAGIANIMARERH